MRSFVDIEDEAERYQVAFDYNNLQSLCKECHSRIHAPHGRGNGSKEA
jgi:hypothetical protein